MHIFKIILNINNLVEEKKKEKNLFIIITGINY